VGARDLSCKFYFKLFEDIRYSNLYPELDVFLLKLILNPVLVILSNENKSASPSVGVDKVDITLGV
jgi:hypothetical protein